MLENFPELQTDRLRLVEITNAHLNDYYNLFKDERVARYYNIIPFQKVTDGRNTLTGFKADLKTS